MSFHDFPWVHFIHNDSGNGSLETSVHPKQFSKNIKHPFSHPHLQLSPRSYEYFHVKCQHAANTLDS